MLFLRLNLRNDEKKSDSILGLNKRRKKYHLFENAIINIFQGGKSGLEFYSFNLISIFLGLCGFLRLPKQVFLLKYWQ
jgi:hypothetical protein